MKTRLMGGLFARGLVATVVVAAFAGCGSGTNAAGPLAVGGSGGSGGFGGASRTGGASGGGGASGAVGGAAGTGASGGAAGASGGAGGSGVADGSVPCTGNPADGHFDEPVYFVRQGGTVEVGWTGACASAVEFQFVDPYQPASKAPAQTSVRDGGVLVRFTVPADVSLAAGQYRLTAQVAAATPGGQPTALTPVVEVFLDYSRTMAANRNWAVINNAYVAPLGGGPARLLDIDLKTRGGYFAFGPKNELAYSFGAADGRFSVRAVDLGKTPLAPITLRTGIQYFDPTGVAVTPDGSRVIWPEDVTDHTSSLTADLWSATFPDGTPSQFATAAMSNGVWPKADQTLGYRGTLFAKFLDDGGLLYTDGWVPGCGTAPSAPGRLMLGSWKSGGSPGPGTLVQTGPFTILRVSDDGQTLFSQRPDCPGSRNTIVSLAGAEPSWAASAMSGTGLSSFEGTMAMLMTSSTTRRVVQLPDGPVVTLPAGFPPTETAFGQRVSFSTTSPWNSVGAVLGGNVQTIAATAFGATTITPFEVSQDDRWVGMLLNTADGDFTDAAVKALDLTNPTAQPVPAGAGMPGGGEAWLLMRGDALVTRIAWGAAPGFAPQPLATGAKAFFATCDGPTSVLQYRSVSPSVDEVARIDVVDGKQTVVQRLGVIPQTLREIADSHTAMIDANNGSAYFVVSRAAGAPDAYRPCTKSHGGVGSAR